MNEINPNMGPRAGGPDAAGCEHPVPGPEIPITAGLLVVPMYWMVAYDGAGAPICGQAGAMHPAEAESVDWARNCLAMLMERAWLLARWIRAAEAAVK